MGGQTKRKAMTLTGSSLEDPTTSSQDLLEISTLFPKNTLWEDSFTSMPVTRGDLEIEPCSSALPLNPQVS